MSPSPSQWRGGRRGVDAVLGALRVNRGRRMGQRGRNGVSAGSAEVGVVGDVLEQRQVDSQHDARV